MQLPVSLGKVDGWEFDRLLVEQDPFGDPGCCFDLRSYKFISAAALVQLIVACRSLGDAGRKPVILLGDRNVAEYLARAGFVRSVQKVAQFEPPFAHDYLKQMRRRYGTSLYLVEATRIKPGIYLEGLLNQVVDVLMTSLLYRPRDAYDVASGVSEICQNSLDHNSQTCGFLAMQSYGEGKSRFLEVAVADYGVGLATSLARNRRNASFTSDLDAIRSALTVGVSGCDEPTRGQGLPHLVSIVRKHAGSIRIRSGSAVLGYRMDRSSGARETALSVSSMCGVQISFTLPSPDRA